MWCTMRVESAHVCTILCYTSRGRRAHNVYLSYDMHERMQQAHVFASRLVHQLQTLFLPVELLLSTFVTSFF